MLNRLSPIIVVLVLAACGSVSSTPSSMTQPSERATPPPSATVEGSPRPSPTLAPSPSGVAPALAVAWSEAPFGEHVNAVVADGHRFVAVGGGYEAWTAWTSTDGIAWTDQAVPGPSTDHCDPVEPICLERSAYMGPMVRLHDTLYSFGGTEFFNDVARAVGWRWTDGQAWQLIESDSAVFGGAPFRAATASDSAIFAVTHAGYPFHEYHWLWTPATSWQEVGEPISIDNPLEFRSASWADGRFLAVGADWDPDPDVPYGEWASSPGMWTSTDGETWTALPAPDEAETLCAVAAPDGFFMLGMSRGQPTVWRSSDGLASLGTPLPTSVADAGCTGSIIEAGGGFLAFVTAGDRTLTWTSTDGTAWEAGDDLPIRTGPSLVAGIDDTIVAFGAPSATDGDQTRVLIVGAVSIGES